MATETDTFANSDNIASFDGSEIDGGNLQSKLNTCVDMDGARYSFVSIGEIPVDADLQLTESDFSISCWIRLDPELSSSAGSDTDLTDSFGRIVDKGNNNGSNSSNGYGMYLHNNRQVYLASDGTAAAPSKYAFPQDGKWQHLVGITKAKFDGSNWRIAVSHYVNARFVAESYMSGSYASEASARSAKLPDNIAKNMYIGARGDDSGGNDQRKFDGKVVQVYIHNTALTQQQISDIYYRNYHPSSSLVEGWDLHESSGTNAPSNSGSFDGTLSGNAAYINSISYPSLWSKTVSNNIGSLMSSPSSIDSFSYTIDKWPAGKNARIQFSSDGSTWKSPDGSTLPVGFYRFDGVDDYISLANYYFGSSNFSFSCWFRSNIGSSSTQHIAGDRTDGTAGLGFDGWRIYIDSTGTLTAIIEENISYILLQYEVNVVDSRWHHVAITWDSTASSLKMYLDGSEVHSELLTSSSGGVSITELSNNINNVHLGRTPNSVHPFYGDICHPLVYNEKLTDSEIANIYKYHYIPSSNLIAEYLFNGNADDNVGSYSGFVFGPVNFTDLELMPNIGYSLKSLESYRFSGGGPGAEVITVPDADQLDFGTGSFTVAADIFLDFKDDNGGWVGPIKKATNNPWVTFAGYQLLIEGGGAIDIGARAMIFTIGDGSTRSQLRVTNLISDINYDTMTSTSSVSPGSSKKRWTRVHGVVDRSTNLQSIYVDGYKHSNDVSCSAVGSVSNSQDVKIGENYRSWEGKVANVSIWSDARSSLEIQTEIENGYVDLSDANLVGHWPLNQNGNDESSYDNHATIGETSTDPQSEIDVYRSGGVAPSSQTIDLSALSLTDSVYYRLISDTHNQVPYSTSFSEFSFEYSTGGGGGGDPISGPTTKTLSFASSNGDEEIIAAPDANKNIVLLGATSSVACVLKQTDASGAVIAYIPAGHSKFKAPVKVASGTAVHVQGASNITLFFTQIHS